MIKAWVCQKRYASSFISFASSHIFLSWLVSNFSCFIFVVELPCWWSTLFKTKKMLTKVTLKEFMRILPQLEFAIKRLVNLKNHYYSSMLFGTWKKTSLNQLDAVDYCTTDAIWWLLSKSFFNYVFFLSLFFYAQILFHIIFSKPIFIVSCWYYDVVISPYCLLHCCWSIFDP